MLLLVLPSQVFAATMVVSVWCPLNKLIGQTLPLINNEVLPITTQVTTSAATETGDRRLREQLV